MNLVPLLIQTSVLINVSVWNEWEVWGECSTLNSCGKGSRSRTRTCGNGGKPGVDRYCLGPVNETMACDSVPCSGTAEFSQIVFSGKIKTCIFKRKINKNRYADLKHTCIILLNQSLFLFPSFLSIGMVRLRDGEKFGEGRVEMYHSHSKKWMQVCGERWTQRSADTACKQRGFLGAHRG